MSTPPMISRQPSAKGDAEVLPIEMGLPVWIPSNDRVWEKATVMAIGDLKVTVRTSAGKVAQVDRIMALPLNPRIADDMTSLYYIHEPGILHNLEERSKVQDQRPYTFMANVLIAVNPLRKLEDPAIHSIINSTNCDPHPYSVAELAFQQMAYNSSCEMPTNQSVVISGESGAGKTESSKIVLRHLTSRGVFGKKSTKTDISMQQHQGDGLDQRLIEQNPVLEAFGNAKTLRNHNSSRFGKFMKLQFSDDGSFKLAGAFVETYLLEKSRLVYQVEGERNFHIFYQLLAGADDKLKDEVGLTIPQDYRYLNQSGCYIAEETDDALCFKEMRDGLLCVGISDAEQSKMFGVIASLLHLGNIGFDEEETPEGVAAVVSQQDSKAMVSLNMASNLLGVDTEYLVKTVCEREISTKDETFTVRRNAQNAIYARDAIAKSLYARLFDWLLKRINSSLGQYPGALPYIGVLDIFGFESFQRNDFEQLLINYTNEVLQSTFNNQVFIAEMELYEMEGIRVGKIEWPDNRECVDLIASKPLGILAILDSEAQNPKPSDTKFLSVLHRTHCKNEYFPRPHPKDMQEIFIVRHFAGCVSYTVGAFIDKNNDTIPKDFSDLFFSSSSPLIVELFQDDASASCTATTLTSKEDVFLKSRTSPFFKSSKSASVARKFSEQMKELVQTLDATRCNFIRCIKPNAMMRSGLFDPRYVVGQLRCQGVMQTAKVLKVGLPTRVSYQELVRAYKMYMPPDAQRLFINQSDATLISAILWAFQVPMDCFKLGISKLFFKAGKISLLDAILKINWAIEGPRIVGRMKLWLARRRWRVALAKIVSQNEWKKLLRRARFRRDAVRMIQIWWRGFSVRRVYMKQRTAVVLIQAVYRGYKGRTLFKGRKMELMAAASARAEMARKQAQEAMKRQEEARLAAEEARREALRQQAQEAEVRAYEAEVLKAEKEALALAALAQQAIAEAEEATAAVAAAVEAERQAELRAAREAKELEARMTREREEAEKRKQDALLAAAMMSAKVTGGLASATTVTGASGPVKVVDIPENMSQENREQLQQLNELLLNGAISQAEYDELVPFLLTDEPAENVIALQRNVEEQEGLNRLYESGMYGIQIRCPACGASNNTANGNYCNECGSQLTVSSPTHQQRDHHSYYGYRTRSMSQSEDTTMLDQAPGLFMKSGQHISIHGGYFVCQMHGTQILADENYAEYTVYVLRCGWQPEEGRPTYWLVSHRYSMFEKLHKDLKHKIPTHLATLPSFPRKHVFGSVFAGRTGNSNEVVEERKRGLERYINQVIELCAQLPDTLSVPELDRFLNLSAEVNHIKRQNAIRISQQLLLQQQDEHAQHAQQLPNNQIQPNTTTQVSGIHSSAGSLRGTGPTGVPTYEPIQAERLAAREQNRKPTELPNPLAEDELTQMEQAVAMLNNAIVTAQGDLRRNHQVQYLLKVCVQLQPRLQVSASVDNPFADMELIPRAMQCQEDLERAIELYNDSLLAVTETYAMSSDTAPPPSTTTTTSSIAVPLVPAPSNSYERSSSSSSSSRGPPPSSSSNTRSGANSQSTV